MTNTRSVHIELLRFNVLPCVNELSRKSKFPSRVDKSSPTKSSPTGGHAQADTFRRRRLSVGLALSLAVLLGGFGVASASGSDHTADHAADHIAEQPVGQPVEVYVVQSGDTLWSIARSLQPQGDIRRLVRQLAKQNGGPDLRVGTQIVLP